MTIPNSTRHCLHRRQCCMRPTNAMHTSFPAFGSHAASTNMQHLRYRACFDVLSHCSASCDSCTLCAAGSSPVGLRCCDLLHYLCHRTRLQGAAPTAARRPHCATALHTQACGATPGSSTTGGAANPADHPLSTLVTSAALFSFPTADRYTLLRSSSLLCHRPMAPHPNDSHTPAPPHATSYLLSISCCIPPSRPLPHPLHTSSSVLQPLHWSSASHQQVVCCPPALVSIPAPQCLQHRPPAPQCLQHLLPAVACCPQRLTPAAACCPPPGH
jgi:hypothetical protein